MTNITTILAEKSSWQYSFFLILAGKAWRLKAPIFPPRALNLPTSYAKAIQKLLVVSISTKVEKDGFKNFLRTSMTPTLNLADLLPGRGIEGYDERI